MRKKVIRCMVCENRVADFFVEIWKLFKFYVYLQPRIYIVEIGLSL